MMQFKINLATRSYVNLKQLNIYIAVVAVLLAGCLIYSIMNVSYNQGEIWKLEKEIGSLDSKIKGETKKVRPTDYEALLGEIRFANSIIAKKNIDWINLLNELESVMPAGVSLSSVEPDVKTQTLKLTGAAKTFPNLRDLFERLEASPYFQNVFLQSQTALKVGENQTGVGFVITCKVLYQ